MKSLYLVEIARAKRTAAALQTLYILPGSILSGGRVEDIRTQ